MTRKDYIAIAKVIKREHLAPKIGVDGVDRLSRSGVISGLTAVFRADNPNFDSRRFAEACGITFDSFD